MPSAGMMEDPVVALLPNETNDEREANFNNGIREVTIIILTGMILFVGAYFLLCRLRRQEGIEDAEDEIVYKVSFAMCCVSLAVSVGSTLLLPISSISNEVLHRYPQSWYIQWLNSSLIHGIWNFVFVLSNLSLFVFLPFAYLFCESEGFFGYKKGLLARAKETTITLLLLSITIMGLMYIITALIDWDSVSLDMIINMYSYLPMLYSWVSFFGVLLLLLCTPLGYARLFTVVGDLVVRPKTTKNLEEEYLVATYEEHCLRKKVSTCIDGLYVPPMGTVDAPSEKGEMMLRYRAQLEEATDRRQVLSSVKRTPLWRRTAGYPLIMMLLFALTSFSLLCVVNNVCQIVAGFRSLPGYENSVTLGISSVSSLGATGVILEVVLIVYLIITSLVGLYTIPFVRTIRPSLADTTLNQIILNCGLYVILSSALPLLAKILGITNFDLLGSFGRTKWLGNFYIVLLYNAIFACATSLCLFNKFTARVRHEIVKRVLAFLSSTFNRSFFSIK